jgi:hypothetical protein
LTVTAIFAISNNDDFRDSGKEVGGFIGSLAAGMAKTSESRGTKVAGEAVARAGEITGRTIGSYASSVYDATCTLQWEFTIRNNQVEAKLLTPTPIYTLKNKSLGEKVHWVKVGNHPKIPWITNQNEGRYNWLRHQYQYSREQAADVMGPKDWYPYKYRHFGNADR